jgi:hypothetical protein
MNGMSRRAILTGAAALAAGTALGFGEPGPAPAPAQRRSARFDPIDAALYSAIQNGDVAGVVALAATARGI